MNNSKFRKETVLALYFNTIGFGYAVFEGISEPVDWKVRRATDKHDTGFSKQVRELLDLFDPSVVVVRKCLTKEQWACSDRTKQRTKKVKAMAKKKGVRVVDYSRVEIRQCFSRYGAVNKDEIARAIGQIVPDFEHLVPPMRACWDKEAYRMGVFDATSLIITYYWADQLDKRLLL
jgi:hypothetical protein